MPETSETSRTTILIYQASPTYLPRYSASSKLVTIGQDYKPKCGPISTSEDNTFGY